MRTFPGIKMVRWRKKVLHSSQDGVVASKQNRPKKLSQWNEDSMRCAYEAVTSKKIGVNRVALEFKVPCTALKDRVSLKVIYGAWV